MFNTQLSIFNAQSGGDLFIFQYTEITLKAAQLEY